MSEITTIEMAPKKRGRKADPAIALLRAQLAEAVAKRREAREAKKLLPKAPKAPKKVLTPEEIEAKRALKADAKKAKAEIKQVLRLKMLEERQVFVDAVNDAQAALKQFDASNKKKRMPKAKNIEVVS